MHFFSITYSIKKVQKEYTDSENLIFNTTWTLDPIEFYSNIFVLNGRASIFQLTDQKSAEYKGRNRFGSYDIVREV